MQDSYNARPHRSQSDDLDAVLPQMPTLLQSPTVHGALTGLLGAGYFRHGHSGITIDGPAPDLLPGAALDASDSHQHGMARLRDGQGWHRVPPFSHPRLRLLLLLLTGGAACRTRTLACSARTPTAHAGSSACTVRAPSPARA